MVDSRSFPKTWKLVRCQDVIDVRDGTHETPAKVANGIPLITSKNLKSEGIDFSDVTYISEFDHQQIEKRSKVDDEDVLFAMIGTIGNPVIVKKDRPFSIKNVALFKLDAAHILPKYFKYLLCTPSLKQQLDSATRGGTQKFVSLQVLRNLEIPLPPIAEQKRIAAILDMAEELRSLRRKALAELDAIVQSIFLEMFGDPVVNSKGWNTYSLNDLIIDGFQNGLYKPSSDYGDGTPILRIDAFYNGRVTKLNSLKRVRITTAEQATYRLQEDDIVINRVNSIEYLGKSALIPPLHEPTVFESNMMRFRLNSKITHSQFIIEFLQTQFIKAQIRTGTKDAVNQSSINQQDVKAFQIRVPPLPLQQEFARRVEAIDRLKATQRQSLAQLDTLFASLQHRAFQGEL